MLSHTPKEVSFPLIPELKPKKNKYIDSFAIIFIINLFVVFLLIVLHKTFDKDLSGLIIFSLIVFYFVIRMFFEIDKDEKKITVYLKSKDRIRFNLDNISVLKEGVETEYPLHSIENIQLTYGGFCREVYVDDIGCELGSKNRISFTHNGEKINIRFYLDNRTWVKLLDRLLFYWAWHGTSYSLYHNARRINKLPIDE